MKPIQDQQEEMLEGVKQDVLKQLGKMPNFQNQFPTFADQVQGFYHAIDWKNDQWIWYIFAAEALLLLLVVLSRRNWNLQVVLFFVSSSIVFTCEWCNNYAKANWQAFSTQDYFDKNGIFLGVIVAAPVLVIMGFQMLNALYLTSHLLVDVKRKEIAANKKKKKTN